LAPEIGRLTKAIWRKARIAFVVLKRLGLLSRLELFSEILVAASQPQQA